MKDDTGQEITHTAPKYIIRFKDAQYTCDSDEIANEMLAKITRENPGEFVDAYQHIGARRYRKVAENGNADA